MSRHRPEIATQATSTVLPDAPMPLQRTFRVIYKGKSAWVKTPVAKGFPLAPLIQSSLQCLAGPSFPRILRLTHTFNGPKALMIEGKRLRALEKIGQPVPHVLFQDQTRLIMTDTGQSVWNLLREGAGGPALLQGMGQSLAHLHAAGANHGQPYPSNVTYDGSRFSFIDLEEDTASVMTLPEAQLRDVWLMAHGVWPLRHKISPDVGLTAVIAYAQAAGPDHAGKMLERLPVMNGRYAKIMHAGYGGGSIGQNLARHAWTYQRVQSGLKSAFTV